MSGKFAMIAVPLLVAQATVARAADDDPGTGAPVPEAVAPATPETTAPGAPMPENTAPDAPVWQGRMAYPLGAHSLALLARAAP